MTRDLDAEIAAAAAAYRKAAPVAEAAREAIEREADRLKDEVLRVSMREEISIAAAAEKVLGTDEDAERAAIQAQQRGPSLANPLAGLKYLPKVALLGRDRILEMARRPVHYVWQDIAVSGTIVVLAGGPGEGKTTLLFLLLAARMGFGETGTPVLGRLVSPAPPGKYVVLIEGEHGEISASRKLERSCQLVGVDDTALDRIIIVARKAVRIGSNEWQDVTKLVAAGLVSDIALDTIARVAPGDANDEAQQVAIFDVVARTIDAAQFEVDKPTVWVCAHTRKGASGSSVEDVSGSAQRTGQADSVLLVKGEKQGGRTISSTVTFIKLREEPDDYPLPTTFAIVGEGGARELRTTSESPTDTRPLEERVVELLGLGPRTKSALAETLKRSREDVDAAISALFGERRITTVDVKIGNRSCKGFALRQDSGNRPGPHPDPRN